MEKTPGSEEDVIIKNVDLVKRVVIEVAIRNFIEDLNLSHGLTKPSFETESLIKKHLEEKAKEYADKIYGNKLIKLETPSDNISFKINGDNKKIDAFGVYVILSYNETVLQEQDGLF